MRLWHWKLIPYLPNQQLLGQWRECCAIRKAMWENETPNHILVNPVCEYPMTEYNGYWKAVQNEVEKRGFTIRSTVWLPPQDADPNGPFFEFWHNDRYLVQCFYNLQEKYDRGGIPFRDWVGIQMFMNNTGLIPHDVVG